MATAVRICESATLDAAKQGDPDAMARLWTVYQPQVLRFLRVKGAPSPDDVASQVWIDVARGLHRFEGDGVGFQRWVFKIANHRSVDAMRRGSRLPNPSENVVDLRTAPSAEQDSMAADSVDDAIALIRRLPPKMAEVIVLRVVFELSVDDTAAALEYSVGNVRVLMHRGLEKLRLMLAEPKGSPLPPPTSSSRAVGGPVAIAATSL